MTNMENFAAKIGARDIGLALRFCLAQFIFGLAVYKTAYWYESEAKPSIKPGQVYRFIFDEKNPYKKPNTVDYRVLDVRNGYVLYLRNEEDTLSDTVGWFSKLGNLIKEN